MEADPVDELPPTLGVEEVAELLGVHPKTVTRRAREGRLPAQRSRETGKWEFERSAIVAVLRERQGCAPLSAPAAISAAAEALDPCDVWGAAPVVEDGEEWHERCYRHWLALAGEAGLGVQPREEASDPARPKSTLVAEVEIDGLADQVRVGPRRRTQYVDDEGDVRWALLDSVWAEPASDA